MKSTGLLQVVCYPGLIRQPVILLLFFFVVNAGLAQRDFSDSDTTRLVILGSGTPNPSPFQSGCSLAIFVPDTPYIFDFGPGLIRKAAALTPANGGKINSLITENIKMAFPYPQSDCSDK